MILNPNRTHLAGNYRVLKKSAGGHKMHKSGDVHKTSGKLQEKLANFEIQYCRTEFGLWYAS